MAGGEGGKASQAGVQPMQGQARLVVEGRGNWVYTHYFGEAERVTIGRGADNDVDLADPHSSARHAEIIRDAEGYRLRDLGSRNGTFLNGKAVTEARLRDGAEIMVGRTAMSFLCEADDPLSSSAARPASERPLTRADDLSEAALRPMMDRLAGFQADVRRGRFGALESDSRALLEQTIEDLQAELRSARETIARLTVVNEFVRLIAPELGAPQMLGTALAFIAARVHAENGFIMLVNPQTKKWSVRARFGEIRDWVAGEGETGRALPLSLTLVEQVVRTREPLVSASAVEDPRFDEAKSVVTLGIQSCLCFPLINGGGVAGVVYVDRRADARPMSKADELLLAALTAQLSQALFPEPAGTS